MLKISISPKNLSEKKYIIDVLFNEFLGLEYQLETNLENNEYVISLSNQKKIIFYDFFWNQFINELDYLSNKNLPDTLKFLISEYNPDKELPVLYGNPVINKNENEIMIEADIFSGAFFFLTRWEEYIDKDKDNHGRFKYENSFAKKFNLVHRPVVNEYVEFLWNILKKSDPSLKRKIRQYTPVITHDIDAPLRLLDLRMLRNSFFRNLIKRKNFTNAFRDIPVYFVNKFNPSFDLGNSYDLLMDASESIGVKSNFFFINSIKTKFDPGYKNKSDLLQKIFKRIKEREHIIGIHSSYYSLEDNLKWKNEYEELCELTGVKIKNGRHHYLRFNVPFTWQIWNDNGLEKDHTLGFAEIEGFRCGTCYSYSVYNFLTRQKLRLKESPLIFMEVSVTEYQKLDQPEQFENKLKAIVNTVKKYNGEFVFLYHNSFFDTKFLTQKRYWDWINIIK